MGADVCLFFFFFLIPSRLKALPSSNPSFLQEPRVQPTVPFVYLITATAVMSKAAWLWQTACWLCDLCKLKFCTNSLIYTRWKTQPEGCYKACCWSHRERSASWGSLERALRGAAARRGMEFMHLSKRLWHRSRSIPIPMPGALHSTAGSSAQLLHQWWCSDAPKRPVLHPGSHWLSVGVGCPKSALGFSLKKGVFFPFCSPAALICPHVLFRTAVLVCSFSFLHNLPIDNLRMVSFKNSESTTLANSQNDYLSPYR